jgi:hypothetical protein
MCMVFVCVCGPRRITVLMPEQLLSNRNARSSFSKMPLLCAPQGTLEGHTGWVTR